MATNAGSNKETRRRRIVERGSDRLALITGRIQTLPSAPDSGSRHSHTASCPPSILEHHHLPSTDSPQVESDTSPFLGHDSASNPGQSDIYDTGSRLGPFMRKCDTISGTSRGFSKDANGKRQSFQGLSTVNIGHHSKLSQYRNVFKPTLISSAIRASETTRIYCSLAAAILVVLSYVDFPILGSHIMRSIIFLRPLYLLLLTNVSVVVARLMLEKQCEPEKLEQQAGDAPPADGDGFADRVGKVLELGLLLQSITGALFMSSSIYATIVICGLSVAKSFGL